MKEKIGQYLTQLGDNPLILGQRLSEWCGHGPALETDIAMTNIALDLLGQTRSYFQLAAEISDSIKDEDSLAFLRLSNQYKNCILVEIPNLDFGNTMVRQYFFDCYHQLLLTELLNSNEKRLAAIAEKSIKEVNYHVKFSSDWILRLGDGTEESHLKIQQAVDKLWTYTKELVTPNELDKEMHEMSIGPDLNGLATQFYQQVESHLAKATIKIPESKWSHIKGKDGLHTEHFGFILSDLQYMQRAYPNSQW